MTKEPCKGARLLVLLVLLGLVITSVACGATETPTTTTRRSPAVTGSGSAKPPSAELVGKTIQPTEHSPAEFVEACGVAPVVVLFYVPGNADDARVFENVKRLTQSFPNYVFLIYDYKQPALYGDLASLLSADYLPQLVLIDKSGVVRDVWHGYIDEGSLNQKLVDLGRY